MKRKGAFIKRIAKTIIGSYAIFISLAIILITISFPLNVHDDISEILWGEWSFLFMLCVMAIAFPILWRHLE